MEWISVENESPNLYQIVLTYDDISKGITVGKLVIEEEQEVFLVGNLNEIEIDYCVTHWMPLPSAPKETP